MFTLCNHLCKTKLQQTFIYCNEQPPPSSDNKSKRQLAQSESVIAEGYCQTVQFQNVELIKGRNNDHAIIYWDINNNLKRILDSNNKQSLPKGFFYKVGDYLSEDIEKALIFGRRTKLEHVGWILLTMIRSKVLLQRKRISRMLCVRDVATRFLDQILSSQGWERSGSLFQLGGDGVRGCWGSAWVSDLWLMLLLGAIGCHGGLVMATDSPVVPVGGIFKVDICSVGLVLHYIFLLCKDNHISNPFI